MNQDVDHSPRRLDPPMLDVEPDPDPDPEPPDMPERCRPPEGDPPGHAPPSREPPVSMLPAGAVSPARTRMECMR
ncbi:hypothetical protein [Burkholderia catarinensis]|uniref:hypothetical protein n=1 Tax=Burkholderia catarinensis TaxID=1108140 RepID=UPI001008667F|nr:hypothetical protein [Burkholderia catarinensis]KAG8152531.1 hypothetical protein BFF94_016985 [Burkholderia catarinensis]